MVTFRQPEEADACIAAVHRRWFDGRTLEAETWDGRSKYTVQESKEEMEKRLNKWHSFIEGDSTRVEGDSESKGQNQDTKMPPTDVPETTSNSLSKSDAAVIDSAKNSSDNDGGV